MKWKIFFVFLLCSYALLIVPFTSYLRDRPLQIKLGYSPPPQVLKVLSAEHSATVASISVLRVLFYYGALLQATQDRQQVTPEYFNMYKTLQGASYLDPYNMDTYYFVQASFTWGLGRINEVNALLTRGMQYRTWDPWIPFYLGFNSAYFQKKYQQAAPYMQRAAEISGNPLFAKLAARYFYESKQTDLGLAFLDTMIAGSENRTVKRGYELRRDALVAVQSINQTILKYRELFKREPDDLAALVASGLLSQIPADPYGGEFYLDEDGVVRSTSKFAASQTAR